MSLVWVNMQIFPVCRNSVISTAYMPFVDIGYYAFGIMGVFYLVEFPFLLWYISTKVMAMDRRGLNRRQCMLYMLKSVVCAGMVLFMQVASWYFTYFLIGLLAYPLIIIALLGACLAMFIFLTASTALLLLPCLTVQKVPTAKWSHSVPYPDCFSLWWINISSRPCFGSQMKHLLQCKSDC